MAGRQDRAAALNMRFFYFGVWIETIVMAAFDTCCRAGSLVGHKKQEQRSGSAFCPSRTGNIDQ